MMDFKEKDALEGGHQDDGHSVCKLAVYAGIGWKAACMWVGGGVGNVLFECKPRCFTLKTGALLSRS